MATKLRRLKNTSNTYRMQSQEEEEKKVTY